MVVVHGKQGTPNVYLRLIDYLVTDEAVDTSDYESRTENFGTSPLMWWQRCFAIS